jgi:hypothetical protein
VIGRLPLRVRLRHDAAPRCGDDVVVTAYR